MILYLKALYIAHASLSLSCYVFAQLWRCQCLAVGRRDEKVGGHYVDDSIQSAAFGYGLFHAVEVAYHIVVYMPLICRVVCDGLCSESRFECFAIKFFQRETVAHFVTVVISGYVGNHIGLYLELDITTIIDSFIAYISIGKFDTSDIGWWNDITTER